MVVGFPTVDELKLFHKHCEIIDVTELYRETRLNLTLPATRLKFRNLERLPRASVDENIGNFFDIFIRLQLQNAGANLETTRYWLQLLHPHDQYPNGFWIIDKTYSMANGHTLMNIIANQMQSNHAIKLDETLTLTMRIFRTQDVQGRGGRTPDNILKKFGVKHNYVVGEGYCLPKAIVIGKHWSDKKTATTPAQKAHHAAKYKKYTRLERVNGRKISQKEAAKKLLEDAGMDSSIEEHTLDHLRELAGFLSEYHIVVWTMEPGAGFPTVIFDENQQTKGLITLYYYDGHFDFFHPSVESMGVRNCYKCCTLVKDRHYKNCTALCKRCGFLECERSNASIHCTVCNIYFSSQKCFDQHLQKKSANALPHCQVWERCQKCCKIHRRFSASHVEHVCYADRFCKICMQMVKGAHLCSHKKPSKAALERALKKQETWRFLVYDIECQVTSQPAYQSGMYGMKHLPNLVCYRMMCNVCMAGDCSVCERGKFSYEDGDNVIERFSKFLVSDPRLKNAFPIAHNGGRYDHVFVLQQITKEELIQPEMVLSGNTILSATLKISKDNMLTFRDSARFMPMALDALPKAFNTATKSKGTFPHMFNHPNNYNTKTPKYPPVEYYEPDRMNVKKHEEFLEWYEQVKDNEFDFNMELLKYCETDVNILTEAIVKFMETCNETNQHKWNPFIQVPTLPSLIMHMMKFEHIQDGDVGFIPEIGWPGRNNSKIALKYILWLEIEKPQLKLQHKLKRGGEHEVKCGDTSYFVDGYNQKTNEVFEVYGCLWHGCDRCYPNREAKNPRNKDCTMRELFERTMDREQVLRDSGYTVHVIWECEIKEKLLSNPEMNEFFKKCRHTHTLRPREAMYGGRTQQFKALCAADSEYDIEYYDFCSEYPKVNMKGGEYPRGIPDIITHDFKTIVDGEPLPYNGLIFCDVLPPSDCLLPVLPYRGNGKLLFPLCASCANTKNPSKQCPHTNESDRYLTGSWCHDELNLAISEGYRIKKYHEVWNWPAEAWFRGGFFESFMKPILKMKHKSSGFPRDNMTLEEKQAHVDAIFANDGVQLDVGSVVSNPALRSLSKLFLNSTWGKFAQNPRKAETKLFRNPGEIEIAALFMREEGYEPKCFEKWGDSHILISRLPSKDMGTTSSFCNIVYGALTTSAARVDLFNAMKMVGAENLIYCDTDSIIFRKKKGTNPLGPLIGEALGQMTNEVPSGWKISQVVAMAPKVYSYEMINTVTREKKYVSKAKGITLNYETCERVNFFSMKHMVEEQLSGSSNHIETTRMRMKRGKNCLDGLESVDETKRLKAVMDKGVFDNQGTLTPFGYFNNGVDLIDDYNYDDY